MAFADFLQGARNFCAGKPTYTEDEYPDLTGRVYIVTGGCTGIGYYVSKFLLLKNAKVWIAARSQAKIDSGIAQLKKEVPNADVDFIVVDFGDLASIKPGVQKFLDSPDQLNGVVHNAGVMTPPAGSLSKQGYEQQLGVNNIGPFLLQKFLDDKLIATAKTAPANSVRILWVSSSAAGGMAPKNGGINWKDINFKKGGAAWTIYGQSKAINIYEAILWAKKHLDSGVVSLTCDPGNIRSELQRHMTGFQGFIVDKILYPTPYGAYTELFGVLHPSFTTEDSGTFIIPFGHRGRVREDIKVAANGENGEKLWNWLDEQVKPYA
ncbi:Env9p [Sugiyamaella lignohabitans]|uniref:Env9p n=1 Tax=Sugiyamaella lignohabitans TaxID=796027 RepID=A0A167DV01_9ASCO|nr:Env9p [Sugiyamaella lignohabitans]ANB13324.1 Env9p [Sugiyamaella lignohabitans]